MGPLDIVVNNAGIFVREGQDRRRRRHRPLEHRRNQEETRSKPNAPDNTASTPSTPAPDASSSSDIDVTQEEACHRRRRDDPPTIVAEGLRTSKWNFRRRRHRRTGKTTTRHVRSVKGRTVVDPRSRHPGCRPLERRLRGHGAPYRPACSERSRWRRHQVDEERKTVGPVADRLHRIHQRFVDAPSAPRRQQSGNEWRR